MSEKRILKCDACGQTFTNGRRIVATHLYDMGKSLLTSDGYFHARTKMPEPTPLVDICDACIAGGIRLRGDGHIDFATVPKSADAVSS